MFSGIRKKIESKRSSEEAIWRFMVWAKDFCYFSWADFRDFCVRLGDIKPVRLRRLDSNDIPLASGEIRAFMIVRNESLRLPYLLRYYAERGIDRFFVVDNGSTDGTVPFLLSRPDVHVFESRESFGRSHFGNRQRRALMKRYADGHWCLIADADEMLVYPHCEEVSFHELCSFLDAEGKTAVSSILLEMYSDLSVGRAPYRPGEDLRSAFPYFDGTRDDIEMRLLRGSPWYRGGMRRRVFGIDSALNKACLVKYRPGVVITDGHHSAEGVKLSQVEGTVLHFKYTSDFVRLVVEEAEREEHWDNAVEYKALAKKAKDDPNLTLYYPGSVRFKDSRQLAMLGMMRTSDAFEKFVAGLRSRGPQA